MGFEVEDKKKGRTGQDLWDYAGSAEESVSDFRITPEEDASARRAFRMDQGDSRRILRQSRRKRNTLPGRAPVPQKKLVSLLAVAAVLISIVFNVITDLIADWQNKSAEEASEVMEETPDDPENGEFNDELVIYDAFTVEVPEGYIDMGENYQGEESQGRIWREADERGVPTERDTCIYADLLYEHTPDDLGGEVGEDGWDDIYTCGENTFYIMYYFEEENDTGEANSVTAYFTDGNAVYDLDMIRSDGNALTEEQTESFYQMLETVNFEK